MNPHRFDLRLSCRYQGSKNELGELRVEQLEQNEWKPLDLSVGSPGFVIFVYSVLSCQHLYLRTNCAERGLILDSAQGSIRLLTDEDWRLQSLRVEFTGRLKTGAASESDIDDIVGRMRQCPVSKNLPEIGDSRTTLTLN